MRHIVKLTGGRLGVRSRKEGGSCFWVEVNIFLSRGLSRFADLMGAIRFPSEFLENRLDIRVPFELLIVFLPPLYQPETHSQDYQT